MVVHRQRHMAMSRCCKLKLLLLNKCRHANFTSVQDIRRKKINIFQIVEIYISINVWKCISIFSCCMLLMFLVGCCSQCTGKHEHVLIVFVPKNNRRVPLRRIFFFSFKFFADIWNSLLSSLVYRFLRMWSLKCIWFVHFLHWNTHFM